MEKPDAVAALGYLSLEIFHCRYCDLFLTLIKKKQECHGKIDVVITVCLRQMCGAREKEKKRELLHSETWLCGKTEKKLALHLK